MRTMSAATLAKIAQRTGIEPINIVRIWWTNSGYIDYADRTFGTTQGKLLSLSDVEDVINVTGNSSSTSVQITLDDTDDSIKEIFNNTDIHRRRVQVLQWFSDIPPNEAFPIFEGEIASPVTWSEGDKTLSFDVLSKLYDREVGFSAEEAQFDWVPAELIGKAWPLIFGTVRNVQGMRITSVPGGLSAESIGATELDTSGKQLGELTAKMKLLTDYASYCFMLAVECYAIASQYETTQKLDRLSGGDTDYTSEIENWESNGDNYLQQGNQYLAEKYNLQQEVFKLTNEIAAKDTLKKNKIAVAGANNFKQNSIGFVNIGGSVYKGFFDANFFNITQQPTPFDDNYIPAGITTITDTTLVKTHSTQLPPNRFVFHEGGSALVIGGQYPTTYIVGLGHLTVIGIQAKKTNVLLGVPNNYWTTQHRTLGTLRYTVVILSQPLSSLTFNTTNASGGTVNQTQGWEDDIYITCVGEVAPLPTVIIRWFISTYTPYGVDEASFEAARVWIDRYPMNFALFDRPNVLQLLTDLAFQSRCALWYNDGKFHLKFLAIEADAIETVTETDVDMNSMQVEYTSTEDLITKFVAEWKLTYDQEGPNKIIFRNNIGRYGTVEETYDFFAYNLQACVEKMAEFWIIRKSNTFKRISFRTYLTKLKIETWDTILLNFNRSVVANGPVKALVESAKFDTSSWKLVVTCWVPVRAGEMVQYNYAWPANLPVEYIYPVPADIPPQTVPAGTLDTNDFKPVDAFKALAYGRNRPIRDQSDKTDEPGPYTVTINLDQREIQPGIPPLFGPGKFDQYDIKPPSALPALTGDESDGVFFGTVSKSLGENYYNVVIPNPAGGDDLVVKALQFAIRTGEIIPEGTPAVVVRKTVRRGNAALAGVLGGAGAAAVGINRTYTMQVPVWVKPKPDETGGSSPPPSPPPPPGEAEPGTDFGDDFGGGGDYGDSGEDADADEIVDVVEEDLP